MSAIRFEPGNFAYHFFGAVAMVAAVWFSHWLLILDVAIFAFLREQAQHRYETAVLVLEDGTKTSYIVRKRTFFDFGWLGWQQVFEIGQWTLGAAVACGVWELFG
jgi:hypothetical protein